MKAWKTLLAATILAALAVPGIGSADHDGTPHEGCQNPYVKVLQPAGGQLIVNGLVVQSGTGQSLTLSTTGTVDVVLEHDCAIQVDLVVTKTGPGNPQVIHQNSWAPLPCSKATITETVAIGLDGGTYRFDVGGMACTGRKLRSDGQGGTIVDPPLPNII